MKEVMGRKVSSKHGGESYLSIGEGFVLERSHFQRRGWPTAFAETFGLLVFHFVGLCLQNGDLTCEFSCIRIYGHTSVHATTCWAAGALPIAAATAALGESNASLSSDTQQPKKTQAGMPILSSKVEGHSPAWYLLFGPQAAGVSSPCSAWHLWAEPL